MNIKALFLIVIAFTFTPSKCGWISDTIGGWFGGIVDKASSGMIDHAKQAFRESMDLLFDTKIQPLINQLEATANRVLDHAKDDINAVIDNFKKEMEELVDYASKKANDLVDHTVEEIKKKIIDEAFDRLNKFEAKLFQDMTTILNKIDAILKEVSCYAQAIIFRITEEIKKALPTLVNPWEDCRILLDKRFPGQYMRWMLISYFSENMLYEYRKCRLINYLTGDSPIQEVTMAYRDLELLAGDMRCLSVAKGAIENEKYYIKEMGDADYILSTLEAYTHTVMESKMVIEENTNLSFLE